MPLDVDRIRRELPGRRIVWLDSVDSTMTVAARLAAESRAESVRTGRPPAETCELIVVAEQQTAGQGRHGRIWHSERESGLYPSVVLRLGLSPADAPVLTLALGLATAEAIARAADLACDLRWPNDVLIDGRKCAGVLVRVEESTFIAGIGINVNHTAFPPEIAATATSLRMASDREHSRERLLVELVRAVESFSRMLVEAGREPILRMFARASSYVAGRRVSVRQGDFVLEGTTDGLDPSGFLLLRRDDGTRELVLAGGVRPLE